MPMATASTRRRRRWRACSTASNSTPASPSISTSARRHATPCSLFAALVKSAQDFAGICRPARQHQSDRRLCRQPAPARSRGASCRKLSPATLRDLAEQGFRGPFAVADGRIIHNAGGSEAQELAFALAAAVDCLRALEAGGVPLDARARHDLFPPGRRRRRVSHHRQIPRRSQTMGARRRSLRPDAEASLSSPPKPRGG